MRRGYSAVLAVGTNISVSPSVISHGGAVNITITNNGATVNPSNNDWIACYSPASSDVTKTTPIRYQFANWTGTWGPKLPAVTTLQFKLNNLHYDYACYLFNGGLKDVPTLPGANLLLGQSTGMPKKYTKPWVAIQGPTAQFSVLAGPANVSFDRPNLPTHVRVLPGNASGTFIFLWNQVSDGRLMPE